MNTRISQQSQESAYMLLEKSRAATERASAASMEAQHIMEGLLNTGMRLAGAMLGMLGSCAGCAGM